jgi:hypothetical protein
VGEFFDSAAGTAQQLDDLASLGFKESLVPDGSQFAPSVCRVQYSKQSKYF